MEHKWLRNFLRVAELGSLSKASDRLRIAQPALSRQIRLIEAELGIALFTRHRRGMELTAAGLDLQRRILDPLEAIDRAIDEMRMGSDGVGAPLALGMPPTVSCILAGRLARHVANGAPGLSLRIVEGYTGYLVDWLQSGEIDAAILYGPAADFHLHTEDLLVEDLVMIGPGGGSLAPDRRTAFNQFALSDLILPSDPHGLRVVLERAAARASRPLNIRFEADSLLVLKELVEAGLGFSALPLSAVGREVATGRLQYSPLEMPTPRRQLILCTLPERSGASATKAIARLIREQIAQLVAHGEWQANLMFEPAPPSP